MSFYLKSNKLLWPTKEGIYDVQEHLPLGTYTVGFDNEKGWFLKPITDFDITGKIYGKTTNQASRVLNTFAERENSTGVLLSGEKGSGKTMLAKMISQEAAKSGISTLVINTPFCGDSFNTFIQEIDEPCIIVFDEFEKVFDTKQQEEILTLLDGVYPTKKLFILTINDRYRVNSHMINRPGRIFYLIDYKGLDKDFIQEYCEDRLDDKSYISQICRMSTIFDSFNFDMLQALVAEMNRYKESPAQALEMLNVKPSSDERKKYHIAVNYKGKDLENNGNAFYPVTWRGNPIASDEIEINIDLNTDDCDSPLTSMMLNQSHLRKIDDNTGAVTYTMNDGVKDIAIITFTRENTSRNLRTWVDAI